MKFGVHLPTFWADYGTSSVRTAIVETAQAAEALGYAGVWANDTVVVSPNHSGAGHVIEPLITLASLAHLVPRLKLGISVLVACQRNVFLMAKQIAALDLFCDGRLILGIGAGWREDEFTFLKADFAHRQAMTDEAIEVLRVLWRDPVASFHGLFYEFSDALLFPKPAQGGNKLDVSRVRLTDISKTQVCPRAREVRHRLKRIGITEGILTVYSDETGRPPRPPEPTSHGRARAVNGTLSYLPPLFGLMLAGAVVKHLLEAE